MAQIQSLSLGDPLRRNRLLAASVLAATIAVSTGCASSPPPVSQQVQDYYDANKDRPLGSTVSPSGSPTVAPAVPVGADLASIKTALAANPSVVISVLGDSTGNATGEWVDLWGKHLAATATVTIHLWDQEKEDWRPTPAFYPGPAGRTIEIWNGSMPGAKGDYPATKMKVMQPAKPDFVILSFGHNGAPSAVAPDLTATVNAFTTQWGGKIPAVAVLQNAAGQPRTVQTNNNQAALKTWASASGTPLIDVRSSFDAVTDLTTVLNPDGTGVHPNAAGQQLWADAVIAVLG